MKRIISIGLALGVMSIVLPAFLILQGCSSDTDKQHKVKTMYYCPMHPRIILDDKGSCPICGMNLVKIEKQPGADEHHEKKILFYRNPMNPTITSPGPAKDSMGMDYVPVYEERESVPPGVLIDMAQQQMIGVKKEIVDVRPLAIEISTVGYVAYDPELFVAQEEYVQTLKTAMATEKSALVSIREQSAALLASSRRKLLLLGMSEAEIETLEKNRTPQDSLYFPGNSGKAWVYMTIYEYEFGHIKEGQNVLIDAAAYPGKQFTGKIIALSPILNAESRSLRVRAEVEDQGGILKPEMFVNARISIDLGSKLSIPEEAVIDSGVRKIVYVVKNNRFVETEVTLGSKAGKFYEVLSGLHQGEEIVTSGNFLIDAESQLKGAL